MSITNTPLTPIKVWALICWDGEEDMKLCGVVTDKSVADEWDLRPGCIALAADLDVLPKGFTRLLAANQ